MKEDVGGEGCVMTLRCERGRCQQPATYESIGFDFTVLECDNCAKEIWLRPHPFVDQRRIRNGQRMDESEIRQTTRQFLGLKNGE